MKLTISEYPGSYLAAELEAGEQLITEKGAMIYCEGDYKVETKAEVKGYKNWIAKLLGGKSLFYNIYTAESFARMAFASKDAAEIFSLNISETKPIVFEPNLHFARSMGLKVLLENTSIKNTLNDGIKVKTQGSGQLFMKGYGRILVQELATEKPVYVDEEALIAYEAHLKVSTISKGVKDLLLSGEGFIYAISGTGTIWIQTREQIENSNGGGITSTVFGFMK